MSCKSDTLKPKLKLRKYSLDICGKFDDLLEDAGIKIPDDDRTGDPLEAPIHGTTYFKLEDDITKILCSLVKEIKDNPNIEIEEYEC